MNLTNFTSREAAKQTLKDFKPKSKGEAIRAIQMLSLLNSAEKEIKQACYDFLNNRCADCANHIDPETGNQLVDEGEFIIEEDRAVGRVTSPDGDYDMDLESTFVGMDDTVSDIYGIEEFATGTTNKAKQKEQLLKKDYVEKNPGEDISSRYGEYDPPEPDYD